MLEHINIQDPLEMPAIQLFEKMVRNVSFKPLAILEKRSILNAWLRPECNSADGYSTVFKIQMEIPAWKQSKMTSLLSILCIWNLGQLFV